MNDLVAALSGEWSAAAVMFAFGALALTGRIVWYTVLRRETQRADKWEQLALDLLQANQKLADAAEVTSEVVSRLPVPDAEAQG